MTAETIAGIFGAGLFIYLCYGIVFSIAFLVKGISRIDETTHGSTWGFKIIIIPGAIALWPLLLQKWIKAKKNFIEPAEE